MLEYRSAANLAITLKDDDIVPCEDLNFLGRAKCSHGACPGPNTLSILVPVSGLAFFSVSFASGRTRLWSCGSILLVAITPQMDSRLLRLGSAEYAPHSEKS